MYWNNPIIEYCWTWPDQTDPIQESLQNGSHVLFFNPAVPVKQITNQQTLNDLLDFVNNTLDQYQDDTFNAIKTNQDTFVNLVKIHKMLPSLQMHGCLKPFLLHYTETLPFLTGTGDSRLKAFACLDGFNHVPAFISTREKHVNNFKHLQQIHNIEQFVSCCNVHTKTWFWFRFTDANAPYGLDWYEFAHPETRSFTVPDRDWCSRSFKNYILSRPKDFLLTTQWFNEEIDWDYWYNYDQ
jgi:hypothetical protein